MYTREDWTLFRTLGTLGQKAGVPPEKIRRLVVKELVDNALDVAGDCSIGTVEDGERRGYYVQDAGSGIPGGPNAIAAMFSINRPLVTSKLLRLPTRGALGNGLRVVAGAVLCSGGYIWVSTGGRMLRLQPQETGETLIVENAAADGAIGTRVEVFLGDSIPADYQATAWGLKAVRMAGGGTSYKGKTSAYWYDTDSFFELLQAAGSRTVRDVITEFDGCTGSKASGTVAGAYLGRQAVSLTRAEAAELLMNARTHSEPVKPERLGAVGKLDSLPACYHKMSGTIDLIPDRDGIAAQLPYVVEAWAEQDETDDIAVCVNRTPVTGDVWIRRQDEKTDLGIHGCGLGYRMTVGRKPMNLVLNVQTPYMPITTDGKEPDLGRFADAIIGTLEKAAGKAKRTARHAGGTAERISQKDVILLSLERAKEKASGNGAYRYSLRQLFYAVRPYVLEEFRQEPDYDYFCQVITHYEARYGELHGLYRDPRGVLYHPHLGENIPIGTLAVEEYQRPPWTFNKILYSEKEGFFSILRADKWPERHDCALLTSKGFASRAVRDVLDLLGETDEEITFFCIHDADASGTMIYQALQEGTLARPGRRVRIINLGLEPWEAQEMELPTESVKRKDKRKAAVAQYVDRRWSEWLQHSRVELNAMTSPEFIRWLDTKMEDYGNGKLIPPEPVLLDALQDTLRRNIHEKLTEQAIKRARVDERAEKAFEKMKPRLDELNGDLKRAVVTGLEESPADRWTEPVRAFAEELLPTN